MKMLSMQAQRLLVVGSGDVAWRALPWLLKRFKVFALCRTNETAERWRMGGAIPVLADLDDRNSLNRLRGIANWVLICAPPNGSQPHDPRLKRLLAKLSSARIIPCRVVYIGTTGVYGDCQGAKIDETRPRRAVNARAQRRVAAENLLRNWLRTDTDAPRTASILRAPGIYAADRLPVTRLSAGTPAIQHDEDSFTSHIHADDLAMAACLALFRAKAGRAYHACDHSELKMGEWFDLVATHFDLPKPQRISREDAERQLPESLLSFMRESRRLSNLRLTQELKVRLRYPTVQDGLAAIPKSSINKKII
jgi:nucleoside-diphosphate-sugar epimerase